MQSKSNNYLAIVMMALGFLLIVLAWNGAASYDTIQQQFPYLLSGGVAGMGLILGGVTLMLIQEMRRGTAVLERKLDELASRMGAAEAASTTTTISMGQLTDRQRRALERAGAN